MFTRGGGHYKKIWRDQKKKKKKKRKNIRPKPSRPHKRIKGRQE
jgi:hypothetical protein